MKLRLVFAFVAALCCLSLLSAGQTPAVTSVSVPPVIQFSNVAADEGGTPLSGTVSITFSLYNNAVGGQALWTETQSVQLGSAGQYSVYLGLTQANGLPTNLFTSGQAQWLGVKIESQPEQPRVFLVSVPYAMKAGDAATIGGLPPSAFVTVASSSTGPTSPSPIVPATASDSPASAGSSDVTTSGGAVGAIPLFSTSTDIETSLLAQTGTGNSTKVTMNDTVAQFGDAFAFGAASPGISGAFTIFPLLAPPFLHMCCNNVPVFYNVFVGGAGNLTNHETDNSVGVGYEALAKIGPGGVSGGIRGNTAVGYQALSSTTNGQENTALGWLAGQSLTSRNANTTGSQNTFIGYASGPGSDTQLNNATAIGANAEVTNGDSLVLGSVSGVNGATSNVNVGIGTTAPSFTLDVEAPNGSTPTVNFGSASNPASLTVNGTGAFTGNVTFASTQTFPNLSVESGTNPTLNIGSSTNAGTLALYGALQIGGNTFDYGSAQAGNAFVGFAGNSGLMPAGTANTAVGFQALTTNASATSTGSSNTAVGYQSLLANSTGNYNTAIGYTALLENTTGLYNTAGGVYALFDNTTGCCNTASGYQALSSNSTNLSNGAVGSNNTASGYQALYYNSTGSENSGFGYYSGETSNGSQITGSNNSFFGYNTGLPSNVDSNGNVINNATAIGASAIVGESNALVLGNGVDVGIGTSTPAGSLHINGPYAAPGTSLPSGNNGLLLGTTADSGYKWIQSYGGALALNPKGKNVGIGTPSPDNMLTVNGSADKPGGGSWGTFSDRRLKDLDGSFHSGLEQVMKLSPILYRYKEENAMGITDHQEHVGLVAQEVQKVIPEAVSENDKGYLLVNNDPIIWAMLNAIKEQQKQIRDLKCELRATRQTLQHVKEQVSAGQHALVATR